MPFATAPRERMHGTWPMCRVVVATRRLVPEREWAVFRALQFAQFTSTLALDEPAEIEQALAWLPGIDAAALVAASLEPETEELFAADRALARQAAGGPTEFQGRSATTPEGEVRFTAPSVVFETADGRTLEAGGFQPIEAYDVCIANLDRSLTRREPATDVAEVLDAFPDGLTTFEVATVMAPHLQPPDRDAAEDALISAWSLRAAPSGWPFGNDALWAPAERVGLRLRRDELLEAGLQPRKGRHDRLTRARELAVSTRPVGVRFAAAGPPGTRMIDARRVRDLSAVRWSRLHELRREPTWTRASRSRLGARRTCPAPPARPALSPALRLVGPQARRKLAPRGRGEARAVNVILNLPPRLTAGSPRSRRPTAPPSSTASATSARSPRLPDLASMQRVNALKGRPLAQAGQRDDRPVARASRVFDWRRTRPRARSSPSWTSSWRSGPIGFRGPASGCVPEHLTVMDGDVRTAQLICPACAARRTSSSARSSTAPARTCCSSRRRTRRATCPSRPRPRTARCARSATSSAITPRRC